jgi:hypothetical protein
MAMFWVRYMVPAFFIGSIFASIFLFQATEGFDFNKSVINVSSIFLRLKVYVKNLVSLLGVLCISFSCAIAFKFAGLPVLENYNKNSPIGLVSGYVLNDLPPSVLIETFESELLFTTPHRYHFPTDLVSMQLVRRRDIDSETVVDYDPMEVDPDYLIVGGYNKSWGLYDKILGGDLLELEVEFPEYKIYRNVKK